jgi:hypothetical protein
MEICTRHSSTGQSSRHIWQHQLVVSPGKSGATPRLGAGRRDLRRSSAVVAAIPQVVPFDDFLDAHELFLGRLDLSEQFLEVAVCLAATALDLIVVVAVPRYKVNDDLKGDEIFPIRARDGAAVVEHHLSAVEVPPALLQKVLNRVLLERLDGLGRRRHNLSHGRERATRAPGLSIPVVALPAIGAIAVGTICIAVHGAGGGGSGVHSIPHSTRCAGGA